jgi:hypothetical protein
MKLRKNGLDQFDKVGYEKRRKLARLMGPCLLIALLIAILYFNSLGHQFTNWDDGMIYLNRSIRNLNWEGIKKIFTLEPGNTYQPIRMLSYAIDYKIWEFNPIGYHITNIFFYILTCVMVYFTLLRLSMNLREEVNPDSHGRVALFGHFFRHSVHVKRLLNWLQEEVLQFSSSWHSSYTSRHEG